MVEQPSLTIPPSTGAAALTNAKMFWQERFARTGPSYVGHVGESERAQSAKIEALLREALSTSGPINCGLDYGCGTGRFESILLWHCDTLCVADILEEPLRIASSISNRTVPVLVGHPVSLPVPPVHLLWCCLVFQHLVDDALFDETTKEIRRVLRPGARALMVDNAVDEAPHVKPRGPEVVAAKLGLIKCSFNLVTIDRRQNDHWFIDGTVGS